MKIDINVKTFNKKSDEYSSFRPNYPEEVFSFLAENCPDTKTVWDCACGTGQVAKSLVNYFDDVKASDINFNQIENSYRHNSIEYSVQDSESTSYISETFDLVCVAQALHWFSSEKYFNEVNRVLKSNGIFVCIGYSFFKISPEIDEVINRLLFEPIRPFWSKQNKLLWDNYSEVDFPFDNISVPEIEMSCYWTITELINYIKTWSAYKIFCQENSRAIITELSDELSSLWNANEPRKILMDFTFYCGRKRKNDNMD